MLGARVREDILEVCGAEERTSEGRPRGELLMISHLHFS